MLVVSLLAATAVAGLWYSQRGDAAVEAQALTDIPGDTNQQQTDDGPAVAPAHGTGSEYHCLHGATAGPDPVGRRRTRES